MTEETCNGIQEEEWRSISGYTNYQVSNNARVRNITTGRILNPCLDNTGYVRIALFNKDIGKTYLVHRLVAQRFIDNPENKSEVDHIDHDPKSNCINNLRWASKSANHMNINRVSFP